MCLDLLLSKFYNFYMSAKEKIFNQLHHFCRQDFDNELLFYLFCCLGLILLLFTFILIFFLHPLWLLIAVPFVIFAVRNLTKQGKLSQIARRIENGFPSLKGYLVNAVELAQYQTDAKEGYSIELIEAVLEETAIRLAKVPLSELINRPKTKKSLFGFIGVFAILTLYVVIFPGRAKLGLYAAFAPLRIPIEFVVKPGDLKVDKESKVALSVAINSPYHFNKAVLTQKTPDGKITKKAVRLQNQTGSTEVFVTKEFDYSFSVFRRQSQTYHIGLLKPLTITSLTLKYIFPPYTRLTPVTSQTRAISVLAGTKIEITGSAETQLVSGNLWFDDSTTIPLTLADTKFQASFIAHQDANFEIRLKDIYGNSNEHEVFKLMVLPDEAPNVLVFLPGSNIDLPISMKVLLGISSIDDYGLTNLNLFYQKDNVKKRVFLKNLGNRLEDTTYYYWDLSNIGFMPGEVIQYYVAVADNDAVSGPKISTSEVLTIRFPTLAEIYTQTISQTAKTQERLEPLSAEQEQLSEELARIDQELKKERQLAWEERKSLENLLTNQKRLLDQIEELRDEVKTALENMFEGLMLDSESLEKLKELENLLSELLPRELKEVLKNLRQALEKPSPQLKQAMEQFRLSQAELKEALARALELLKTIQEEEKLKALAKKAEALYEAQKELNAKFNEESQKLALEENKIKEGLESLEKETEALSQEFSDKEVREDLAKLVEELKELQLSAQASEASQSLQQGQKGQAQKKSQKLLKDLEQLKNALSGLTKKLKDKRSKELTEKLLNSARDLVSLSFEQERLENLLNKDQNLSELAGDQKRLEEASHALAESLQTLSQKSIKIPPNLNEDVIRALSAMENAANNLQENNLANARKMMQQARAGLDAGTAKILKILAQAQASGGFGGGMEGLFEQLSQLTAEQMMLNQAMNGIPIPIPVPGGLTPQQLAQIERILSKQRAIRQTLEEMRQSLGIEPGLMSSLDGVIEEMKQTERDLSELVVSRELIQRQEKILSRLLDVQRSVRRREFKEKREREVGKDYPVPPSPSLPTDLGERKKLLREKLFQALKEGYPKDYERLIKLYFDALLNE